MSYELFRALVAHKQPFHEAGLHVLGTYLPANDAALHCWLERAIAEQDAIAFQYVICAAAMAGRNLRASLLVGGAAFVPDAFLLNWIAWHMEGEVTEELVRAADDKGVSRQTRAMMLFFAAGWWMKFRQGPLPQPLITAARALARIRPVDGQASVTLAALFALAPNEALQDLVPCGRDARVVRNAPTVRDKFLVLMEEPFANLLPGKPDHGYTLGRPMRRAEPKIGSNEPCPCGSGKKYKRCCKAKGTERMQHSTDVAGMTDVELHDNPGAALTGTRLEAMLPNELARLELEKIPAELVDRYFFRLAECKRFDLLVKIFKNFGVRPEWEEAWSRVFSFIVREWQRDAAVRLLKTHKRPKEMLPQLEPGVRLLLASDNQKEFLRAVETEALAALQSSKQGEVQRFVCAIVASPYPALGIFVARSVLPLLEDAKAAALVFDQILHARDRLNLSPDDEFGDFMDERALRRKRHEGDKIRDAQAKLEAKAAEVRKLRESLVHAERALALKEKRENREAAAIAPKPPQDDAEKRALREKVDWLQAKIREEGQEKVTLRRDVVRLQQDLETLKTAANEIGQQEIDEDDDAGEEVQVSGTQPVRLLQFARKFDERLAAFPQHVGHATMSYLGQLCAGEATALDSVVHLKGYHGVLRKRIAGSHRLLFVLTRERVQVVDLIARCDLDLRVKKLQENGLPAWADCV